MKYGDVPFFHFEPEILFVDKFSSKNQRQSCHFKLKFGTWRIQWCSLFFLLSSGNILFWAGLVQKIKVVTLSWNLVPRLIRIYRIKWGCSQFSVFNQKYPFCANLVQKIKIFNLRWNLVRRLIRTLRIQWRRSLFSF